jgi:CDP-glycerol glycerophosphotransferase (TagB/SpsB family)
MVYFADPTMNLYQIRQWLHPLERLDAQHSVLIVTRQAETFRVLSAETELAVVNARHIGTVETLVQSSDIKLAFYVNQFYRNFQVLRYPDMIHVFLSHGESEKASYMATNQLKAYDYMFVAGEAAVNRVKDKLMLFDWERRLIKVGRPQLDNPVESARSHADGRVTVLYAPTWEGDRPSMSFGSVLSHGREIIDAFTSTGRHRLVYRPHPRTGVTLPEAGAADKELRALVRAAAHRDPTAGHRVDLSAQFAPSLHEADVVICDVSAVALDALPTGKPVVVTVPAQVHAHFDRSTFLDSVYELPVSALDRVVDLVEGWCADDARSADRARWVAHYFGDVTPGASMRRFLDACDDLIRTRDELVADKRRVPQPAGETGA